MPFDVRGRVVFLTGGTEGIGRGVAERLLSKGARLTIANRNEKTAAAVLPEMRDKYGVSEADLRFEKMDINDLESVRRAFSSALDAFGRCDVVIANAGFIKETSFLDAPDSEWLLDLTGNLHGTILLGKLAANHWLSAGTEGVFVATSSTAGLHGAFHVVNGGPYVGYALAKAGVLMFTNWLQGLLEVRAAEAGLAKSPIRCNSVCPGWVLTPMLEADNPFSEELLTMEAGWTPIQAVVDAFVACIEDEDLRGAGIVVSGEGGQMRKYLDPYDFEGLISRVSTGTNFFDEAHKRIADIRAAATVSK
ncbi:hypothetical protein DFJ74DRAFT_449925 [Hyaloraphidium curvatum]|nr:hypothetical protein DFJ74DRAFT_449925 [Hyaloraphidium curvatum]